MEWIEDIRVMRTFEPHVPPPNDKHSILVLQVNSKLSHDIKKNDFSLSHMVKNYEGRKQFLRTIELVSSLHMLLQKNPLFSGHQPRRELREEDAEGV